MTAALLSVGWVLAGLGGVLTLLLRGAQRSRREEIARACHELRGPLTAVRLGLSLEERAGELSAERRRALEAELGRAARAVEDLACAGRSFGGRLGVAPSRRASVTPAALEPVALGALLELVVTAAAGPAAAWGARVAGGWEGADATVWGDRIRLSQALANLLANAAEHGGGVVRVCGELRGGRARITVDDDGPGLPAPVAELARRPRAGRGSRGRGLAIALSIAEAHAGTLTAGPVAGGGRVVLTLPAREAARTGSARP